jgi:hypothetical protein
MNKFTEGTCVCVCVCLVCVCLFVCLRVSDVASVLCHDVDDDNTSINDIDKIIDCSKRHFNLCFLNRFLP